MKKIATVMLFTFAFAQTYDIAEPDFLEEIESKKDYVVSYLKEEVKRIKEEMENFEGEVLTPARENRVYYIDPTYCLEEDIYYPEGNEWKILYPKGYCFNPVEYIPYEPPPLVVFNPCRKAEREWVHEFMEENEVILVASGCPVKEVRKQSWEVPVYYLLPYLKKKLGLKHTVSVVSIDKERKAIRVEEIKTGQ